MRQHTCPLLTCQQTFKLKKELTEHWLTDHEEWKRIRPLKREHFDTRLWKLVDETLVYSSIDDVDNLTEDTLYHSGQSLKQLVARLGEGLPAYAHTNDWVFKLDV